jgi:hypothetical protein
MTLAYASGLGTHSISSWDPFRGLTSFSSSSQFRLNEVTRDIVLGPLDDEEGAEPNKDGMMSERARHEMVTVRMMAENTTQSRQPVVVDDLCASCRLFALAIATWIWFRCIQDFFSRAPLHRPCSLLCIRSLEPIRL